jgi:hypothetical protein
MSDGVNLFSPEGQERMDHWRQQVDRIQQWGHHLTKWELDFVASIEERLDLGRPLTDRQVEVLDKIEDERAP